MLLDDVCPTVPVMNERLGHTHYLVKTTLVNSQFL